MIRKFLFGLLLLAPLSIYPLLRDSDSHDGYEGDCTQHQADPLTPDQHLALGCLSILPGQSFPGGIPWEAMRGMAIQETRIIEERAKSLALVELAENDPVEFLQQGLDRYSKEVQGYRCIFDKQEKVNGKLRPKESIRVHFREQPFSVHMEWLKGKDLAYKSLWVRGDNDDLLIVRALFSFGPIKHRKIDADDVKATSRFPVTQFGMYLGAKDTVEYMAKAKAAGKLHVKYLGLERAKEVGNRLCYKFVRTPYDAPEGLAKENLNELTIYIDAQTRLQVGSVLKDTNGKLIAEYLFREIELNPKFDENQFTMDAI